MMENNLESAKIGFGYSDVNIFNDKATKSKINKHLLDINDTITEEDIRNIKVSFPVAGNNHYATADKSGSIFS